MAKNLVPGRKKNSLGKTLRKSRGGKSFVCPAVGGGFLIQVRVCTDGTQDDQIQISSQSKDNHVKRIPLKNAGSNPMWNPGEENYKILQREAEICPKTGGRSQVGGNNATRRGERPLLGKKAVRRRDSPRRGTTKEESGA